jgi:SAM-dependent methyltransferase
MKIIDLEGEQTLNAVAKADKFNLWMYNQMSPYINGDVLEIGSGIGNISKLIKTDGNVYLSDVRDQYIEILKKKFPNRNVIYIDLVKPNFEEFYYEYIGKFDFVFALNVVEHIENDKLALINIEKLLKNKGKMFILVPAYQNLYNHFDVSLEHYRRYTNSTLINIFPNKQNVIKTKYFNSLGIFAWFIVGKILSKKIIPESNMSLYNKIIPLVKFFDFITFSNIGLSVIAVYEKQ